MNWSACLGAPLCLCVGSARVGEWCTGDFFLQTEDWAEMLPYPRHRFLFDNRQELSLGVCEGKWSNEAYAHAVIRQFSFTSWDLGFAASDTVRHEKWGNSGTTWGQTAQWKHKRQRSLRHMESMSIPMNKTYSVSSLSAGWLILRPSSTHTHRWSSQLLLYTVFHQDRDNSRPWACLTVPTTVLKTQDFGTFLSQQWLSFFGAGRKITQHVAGFTHFITYVTGRDWK